MARAKPPWEWAMFCGAFSPAIFPATPHGCCWAQCCGSYTFLRSRDNPAGSELLYLRLKSAKASLIEAIYVLVHGPYSLDHNLPPSGGRGGYCPAGARTGIFRPLGGAG